MKIFLKSSALTRFKEEEKRWERGTHATRDENRNGGKGRASIKRRKYLSTVADPKAPNLGAKIQVILPLPSLPSGARNPLLSAAIPPWTPPMLAAVHHLRKRLLNATITPHIHTPTIMQKLTCIMLDFVLNFSLVLSIYTFFL